MEPIRKKILVLFSIGGIISGCLTQNPYLKGPHGPCDVNFCTSVPPNCEYRGKVIARKFNSFTIEHWSRRQLEVDAKNDMRIQARNVGANVIVITEKHVSYLPPYSAYGPVLNSYGLAGEAYCCNYH